VVVLFRDKVSTTASAINVGPLRLHTPKMVHKCRPSKSLSQPPPHTGREGKGRHRQWEGSPGQQEAPEKG